MLKNKNNDSGIALISAILLMLVLVVLGQAMVYLARNETLRTVKSIDRTKAFYLAEAGVEEAIYELQKNTSFPGKEFPGRDFSSDVDGGYESEVEYLDSDEVFQITSRGYVPKDKSSPRAKSILQARIQLSSPGVDQDVKEFATAAGNNISVSGSAEIDGNAYSGNDTDLNWNSPIKGDLHYVGDYTQPEWSPDLVEGEKIELEEPYNFPSVSTASFKASAMAGEHIEGDKEFSWNPGTGHNHEMGDAYITGDLKIDGSDNVTINGTVFVEGEVEVSGAGVIKGEGTVVSVGNITYQGSAMTEDYHPVLMSTEGNIEASGNTTVRGMIWALNGDIFVLGSSKIKGAAYAGGNITVTGGGSKIEYDESLIEEAYNKVFEGEGDQEVFVLHWSQLE